MEDMEKQTKQMNFIRNLKQEVEINGTGTHKYRIKYGPNKGLVTK
jgi:16S rRNA G527 N7-methylase RsmG|tara:strand:- start:89 stop:223 length:135 start_codon:yes stop_codon:yes gene_type:complete